MGYHCCRMDEWKKILITSIVSSISTAAIAEPIKLFIGRRLELRRLRKTLYRELAFVYEDCLGAIKVCSAQQTTIELKLDIQHYEKAASERLFFDLTEAVALNSLYFKLKTRLEPKIVGYKTQ